MIKMLYTIYQTTNLVNGRFYIGLHRTKNPHDDYLGSSDILKRAIKKYGRENFKKEVLFVFETEQEMIDKEKELVNEEFCARKETYNLMNGGYGDFSVIPVEVQQQTRKQNGYNAYNRKFGIFDSDKQEEWAKLRGKHPNSKKSFLGKRHTKKTLQKMRKSKNVGANNSQWGTMWITNGVDNRKIRCHNDNIPEGYYKGRVIK